MNVCVKYTLLFCRMEMSQDFHSATKDSLGGIRMTRTELTTYAIISFLVVLWCNYKWNRRHFEKIASKMTGPPSYPIIGAGLQFVGTPERKAHTIIIISITLYCTIFINIIFFYNSFFFLIFRGHR